MYIKREKEMWEKVSALLQHFEDNPKCFRTDVGEPTLTFSVPVNENDPYGETTFHEHKVEAGKPFPHVPENAQNVVFDGLKVLFMGRVFEWDGIVGQWTDYGENHEKNPKLCSMNHFRKVELDKEFESYRKWLMDEDRYVY